MPEDQSHEQYPRRDFGPVEEMPPSPRMPKLDGLNDPLDLNRHAQAQAENARFKVQIQNQLPIEKAKTVSLLKKIREKIEELYLIILRRN